MNRIWLVTNAASGTFSSARLDALEAQLERLGVIVVETSDFPRSDLPKPADLERADIDTLALFAGDGSIAAAVRQSAGWAGDVLVLPGGTMNLLAKRLHGEKDVEDIVDAVKAGGAASAALSGARIDDALALVGVIAGPVTAWAQAREDVREGALTSLPGSVVDAVRETVGGEGVRVEGIEGVHRGVLIFPERDRLVAYVPAPQAGAVFRLGWDWIAGDWRESPGVAQVEGVRIRLAGADSLTILADGEPVEVAPPFELLHEMTTQQFYATTEPA